MNAIQLYSSGSNYYSIFIYLLLSSIVCLIITNIYLYFNEYFENINNKIDYMSNILLAQSGILRAQSETIEKKTKQISQLEDTNKLLNKSLNDIQENLQISTSEIQNKIKLLEKNLTDISEHSHINMDKIFALQDTIVSITSKYSELTSKISCNDKDMDYINTRLTIVEKNFIKMVPDYVLIGLRKMSHFSIPVFVPNNFTFTQENMTTYGVNDIELIVSNFKYLENLKEIILDDFKKSRLIFTKCLLSVHYDENRDEYIKNSIISIHPELLPPSPSQGYIYRKSHYTDRTYKKQELRNLRSELSKIDIKLILNEDFEEFIRE